MMTIPTEGFPLAGLEIESGAPEENQPRRGRRILAAMATYLATFGEAVREGKIAPTPDGIIITPELFRENRNR